jgi:hypothetical protein
MSANRRILAALAIVPALLVVAGWRTHKQAAPVANSLLTRHYHDGERLAYHMVATNEGRSYELDAIGTVTKDPAGGYVEDFGWLNLVANHEAITLPPPSLTFRQQLSLDPDHAPSIPNLSQVSPRLIGPITDMLTFYSDLWLANTAGKFTTSPAHLYFKHGGPNSWADGHYVIVGEDSIDFDISLEKIDSSKKIATLIVKHVPPKDPGLKFPAEWMNAPVADTPNNWVEVVRDNGRYYAEAGKETFDVTMQVSLVDGKILSGVMDNPVVSVRRECSDEALSDCTSSHPHLIKRHIEISLQQ